MDYRQHTANHKYSHRQPLNFARPLSARQLLHKSAHARWQYAASALSLVLQLWSYTATRPVSKGERGTPEVQASCWTQLQLQALHWGATKSSPVTAKHKHFVVCMHGVDDVHARLWSFVEYQYVDPQ
eukprot:TRINITY_DN10892_c0_g1_i1.p1 TRINITY_DN10892_c0_g1~~TRINITY_DN10892_c0_g1_i1.p1  ORF type:complete len:127 (-),score=10.45 TRINITY_DN10892_c0_g1_i1:51-431(-)